MEEELYTQEEVAQISETCKLMEAVCATIRCIAY